MKLMDGNVGGLELYEKVK